MDVEVEFDFVDLKYYNIDKFKERIFKERNFIVDKSSLLICIDVVLIKVRDELFIVVGGDRVNKFNVMVVFIDGKFNFI